MNSLENYDMKNPYEIARYIKEAEKSTPYKVYVTGNLEGVKDNSVEVFGSGNFYILFGDGKDVENFLHKYSSKIRNYKIECDRRNSAIPMLDIRHTNARIEPGALIRDGVIIGDKAVIMMGAVINIGAEIGEGSMVDMNAVIGARGKIGKNVHVGAGSVVAGVLEPPSSTPVVIEDDVLIGANSVILEGVHIGKGAVVAAGSVVTKDVGSKVVVAGTPAVVVKSVDEKTKNKTQILQDLRK